jgi:hypothetical protein
MVKTALFSNFYVSSSPDHASLSLSDVVGTFEVKASAQVVTHCDHYTKRQKSYI